MPYYLPNFNLNMIGWHGIGVGPPDYGPVACQIFINSRVPAIEGTAFIGSALPAIYVRSPSPGIAYAQNDALEIPAGSGDRYNLDWVEYVHRGFPNEYVLFSIHRTIPWSPHP